MTAGLFDVPYYYYDEGIYVDAGQSLWDGTGVENWEHPPVGKYFILAGRLLTENKVLGSRWPALAAALFCLLLLSGVAEHMFREKLAKGFPSALTFTLALSDPLFVNLGKMAMLDIYALMFVIAGLWLTTKDFKNRSFGFWILLGLSGGLAMATKWSTLPVFAVFYFQMVRKERWPQALMLSLSVGAAAYFSAFIPYKIWLTEPVGWIDIVNLNRSMLEYHQTFMKSVNPHFAFWEWLVLPQGSNFGIAATGNLFIYILGVAGILWAWGTGRPKGVSGLLALGLLSTVLFWVVLNYRQMHPHYFLLCAPFIYLGVLTLFVEINSTRPKWSYAALAGIVLAIGYYGQLTRVL